jgi:uncharacterized protein YdeI (BOF family)
MQPISLYLELKEGELPDVEVAASATLAFAKVVKEIVFIVDPSAVVKLDLDSTTSGSLSINSVIKFLRDQIADPVTRKAIVLAVLFWFAKETGAALWGAIVTEAMIYDPAITEQDAGKIADEVVRILDSRIGKPQVEQVYEQLERDHRITGVGVTTKKGDRPRSIVPREQFRERSGLPGPDENTTKTRTTHVRTRLVLVRPVLQINNHKWLFESPTGKMSADIKDAKFLDEVVNGRTEIPLRGGIELDVLLEVKEEKVDQVWTVKDRSIERVYSVYAGQRQDDLFSGDQDRGGEQSDHD